ncbi:MAG TPA: 50S ribosomal protein L4 [Patescibacteria group bacterium]|nr:50S ribosomal protein L4 [Patescibacteria group bacterium]
MAEAKKQTKTKATSVSKKKAVEKVIPTKKHTAVIQATVQATSRTAKKATSPEMTVVDTSGKTVETMALPENIFAAKVNARLMAQAVRVHLMNQRKGTASTKTRGEVEGSTRKIYRQKGTGRARHGGIRAPIFVKGGIAHGPKPRDYSLTMPTKMKRKALFSALTTKLQAGDIILVAGLEKLEPKTKIMAQALQKIGRNKERTLLVMDKNVQSVFRAANNIADLTVQAANRINTYIVLDAKKIILMKDAISTLEQTFGGKK